MPEPTLAPLATAVLTLCRSKGLHLATAESCTGGMVAAALTDIAGSSDVVERGLVTYSNEAKSELLGVPEKLLETHGAVSAETAAAMAAGALGAAPVDLAVAITGIAGPGGATPTKPVGLVWFGCAR
ncbi:MAG TPA: CinA family protein, partial [Stellaceae bacterium]|nr:CinA family protein [Stellaceae bacterium]